MNILLTIHHQLDRNAGAPGVTLQLADAYRRLGHEVELFGYDHLPKRMPNKIKKMLFPFFVSRFINRSSCVFDIVDASSSDGWVWAMITKGRKRKATTLISRSHGLELLVHEVLLQRARAGLHRLSWKYPLYNGGFHLWEVAQSFRKADGAVFLNQAEQEYGKNKLGMSSLTVIGNGIPDYLLGCTISPTPVINADPVGVAIIGRYDPLKGVGDAAEVLQPLMRVHPSLRVTFLGTSCPIERVLSDYEADLHARIAVVPRYEHRELPVLLKDHHIKLFPTVKEGSPLVLVEAMACGLAPVTTTIPGPSDMVSDGKDGLLVPPANAEELYRALDRILTDRQLLDRLRQEAYKTAQRYSWDDIAHRTIAYYESCRERKGIGGFGKSERKRFRFQP